ncbi:hypothetical protein CH373_11010 [Leptospira perolatii]|uniref:HEAT repeat domain-containing protein n=1 Tax=Leptospira perolatii TaxID=2023191 RepID=A0A2M9ZM10_9LEPT|nr:hypothetical protein [Leptospira perolatii]PJZ69761.1 hypothetical protein CH360_09225 [Leptospira perolatii]PJZ73024.1 hypothetical protein CH373_11010 [Leptospira perolatii]
MSALTRLFAILLLLLISTGIIAKEPIQEKQDQLFFEQVRRLETGTLEERIQAADYLKFVRSKLAVHPLLKALKGNPRVPKSDENFPTLKFVIAQALGAMEQEFTAQPMLEEYRRLETQILENEVPTFSSPDGYNMVIAVGELLRSVGSLPYDKTSADTISNALGHPNFYIRASAADGLKNQNKKDSLPALNAALDKEKNSFAKVSMLNAIVSINRIADKRFYELCDFLKDESSMVRYRASMALGEIDLKAGEMSLRQALLVEHIPMVREQIRKDLALVTGFKLPATTVFLGD